MDIKLEVKLEHLMEQIAYLEESRENYITIMNSYQGRLRETNRELLKCKTEVYKLTNNKKEEMK